MNPKIESSLDEAAAQIRAGKRVIAFTGAGISVESGIPPFRGPDGLWSKYNPIFLDIEYFSTHPEDAWKLIKEIFYDYFGQARPNPAHYALAQMETCDSLHGVITQSIDNLHQEAGSRDVIEYHGTSHRLTCISCHHNVTYTKDLFETMPPRCPRCGGILKPDFVFFGEPIPSTAHQRSQAETLFADIWLVIGTTGEIMPASFLPIQAKQNGAKIIEVNIQPSKYTHHITDIFLEGKAGEILPALADKVCASNGA